MNDSETARHIATGLGLGAREIGFTPLAGGDINRAFRLDADGERFFVKLNSAARLAMFEAERKGLEAIAATATIRVPEAYSTGIVANSAFIVMEYIELYGRADPLKFAEALAAMHQHCAADFGFDHDNTIGSTCQPNARSADWLDFWRQRRLGFQLRLAAENGVEPRIVERGFRLADNLEPLFGAYRPRASLLHGDLWGGNQGADAGGNPVIYDPACYHGDHEAELAMMELFGSPGERFFAAYDERFPIDPGYTIRRELYNLYHVLNHANLFGGGYVSRAGEMISRLLSSIGR